MAHLLRKLSGYFTPNCQKALIDLYTLLIYSQKIASNPSSRALVAGAL